MGALQSDLTCPPDVLMSEQGCHGADTAAFARSGCGDMSYTVDSSAVSACVLARPGRARRKPGDLPLGVS